MKEHEKLKRQIEGREGERERGREGDTRQKETRERRRNVRMGGGGGTS